MLQKHISDVNINSFLLIHEIPRLGSGTKSNQPRPHRITFDPPPPDDVTVRHVTAGSRHSMVLLSNGQVFAFGNNFYAQLGYDFKSERYKENQVSRFILIYLCTRDDQLDFFFIVHIQVNLYQTFNLKLR